jgi:hypothetical protein
MDIGAVHHTTAHIGLRRSMTDTSIWKGTGTETGARLVMITAGTASTAGEMVSATKKGTTTAAKAGTRERGECPASANDPKLP